MNPKCLCQYGSEKRATFESLKTEYDSIKNDIITIKRMDITDEARELPLKELYKQIDDVKENMHNYIDTL